MKLSFPPPRRSARQWCPPWLLPTGLLAAVLFTCGAQGDPPPTGRASSAGGHLLGAAFQPATLPAGETIQLVLRLNRPAGANGVTVALASSDPKSLVLPARLTIPAGVSRIGVSLPTQPAAEARELAVSARELDHNGRPAGPVRLAHLTLQPAEGK